MKKCLICNSEIKPFISYGQMPIANGFLSKEKFNKEYFFHMQMAHCTNCSMIQLIETPERQLMFNENYAFFSGTSQAMKKHFFEFAEDVKNRFLPEENSFVVEIGSNDGIMLQNFKEWGIRHLGIEPSANVAQVSKDKGINTIVEFFDEKLAEKIVTENGQADAFIAANVMCHLPYFHSIVAGISKLVKKTGIVIFEEPYVGDVVEKTSYDQIYDEHVFLFSALSIKYLFEQVDLELIDLQRQPTHGGSMRYFLAHKGKYTPTKAVSEILSNERILGLDKMVTFEKFSEKVTESKNDLVQLLTTLKSQGHKVVGYAATSKSTTILNYCGIGPDLIDYICDTTPIKQNKYSPGMHIPVRPYEEFKNNPPEYAFLFAWNHQREILDKENDFINRGGKWITHVPKVQIL